MPTPLLDSRRAVPNSKASWLRNKRGLLQSVKQIPLEFYEFLSAVRQAGSDAAKHSYLCL